MEARVALLAEVNEVLQFDLPLDDYLWRFIADKQISTETGAFVHFDLSKHEVFDLYADQSRRNTGYGSSYEPVNPGGIFGVTIYGQKATTKNYCGDAIRLRTKHIPNEKSGLALTAECLDGVTEMPKDDESRAALRDRLQLLIPEINGTPPDPSNPDQIPSDPIPSDQIANKVVSELKKTARRKTTA